MPELRKQQRKEIHLQVFTAVVFNVSGKGLAMTCKGPRDVPSVHTGNSSESMSRTLEFTEVSKDWVCLKKLGQLNNWKARITVLSWRSQLETGWVTYSVRFECRWAGHGSVHQLQGLLIGSLATIMPSMVRLTILCLR